MALTDVRKEDHAELKRLTTAFIELYNNNRKHQVDFGDIVLGGKAQKRIEKQLKAREAEMMHKK